MRKLLGATVAVLGFLAMLAGSEVANAGVCGFYRDSWFERNVCESAGDDFPNYRDCLQREKSFGEGFVDRHASCLNEGHRRESAFERREARANEGRSGGGCREPAAKEPKQPREGKN